MMKTKEKASKSANEWQFELKYCERCGALWVRPVGGEEIYCLGCGREMAQLPPASHEAGTARVPQGPRWDDEEDDFEGYEEYEGLNLDTPGGVA